jgi:purine-nucleoside phosphorylase
MTSSEIPSVLLKIQAAVERIEMRAPFRPALGVVVGSGLGSLAAEALHASFIPYSEIPYFHGTTIEGVSGRLVFGHWHGVPTAFLQGRLHFYEGYPMEDVVFPTRVLCGLGIETLLLTNAAGGINSRFRPGDLMVIEDHINLLGDNPLKGRAIAQMGSRFPDLTEAYSKTLVDVLGDAAKKAGVLLHRGVYAAMVGPTFETPAEVRMLRALGADAVGMSTVPECIAANHLGVNVVGLSCITNLAAGLSPERLSHDRVIENSGSGLVHLSKLLELAVPSLVQLEQETHDSNQKQEVEKATTLTQSEQADRVQDQAAPSTPL